ncbi:MAG: YfaZ family outer membrane protein [Sinobacteraceae bacterium]|nr:hypothetical protein [Nevskia sp.]MDI3259780.1 YfaZ family outer membrane protein [Nevskiaceae bacterium]
MKRSAMLGWFAALLASPTVYAAGGALGLDFNDSSFRLSGALPLYHFVGDTVGSVEGGYLYDGQHDHDHVNFGHVGVLASGNFGLPDSTAGIGLRGFYAKRGDFGGQGLAIGGQVDVRFPGLNRLGVLGTLYYAPEVLTGGDYKNYFEFGLDLGYQIIRPATVYVGYRRLELPLDRPGAHPPDTADQGGHIGIRLSF